MDRRGFLKTSLVTGATAFSSGKASANGTGDTSDTSDTSDTNEFVGILVDTTRCIGCRACEVACGTEHDLLVPDVLIDGALQEPRLTSPEQWTIVNKYETEKGDVFVKRQCMHCFQAACATACPTEAMYKTENGPVIWRGSKCLGCRYCMVSCPFDIPKFEYNEWNPKIQKCTMCFERLEAGEKPACVEACPTDALMFGTRVNNLGIARHRIYSHPDDYVHHIYGEREVGGTGYIYLSAVPFDQIGFRMDLGITPYPEYTKEFLYAVPMILFGLPAFLLGLNALSGSSTQKIEGDFEIEVEVDAESSFANKGGGQ